MHLALIGLPGSGKSTIGRYLARQCGWDFIDTDHVIEQRLGGSIRDYFASHGEAAFRDVETQVLLELLQWPTPAIVSTGGGGVLREANRIALRAHSVVFYLQTPPEDIARRLRNDTARPLMQGVDPLQRLRDLLAVRAPLYTETAHYVVDTARQSTAQVARKICMQAEMAGLLPLTRNAAAQG